MSDSQKLTISRAMTQTIGHAMRTDPSVFVMGEDIGKFEGVFDTTVGLLDEFGSTRVRDTPISETGFIGAGVGAAMSGMRPIVELMFVDFFGVCMDTIYNLAAKNTYFSAGNTKVPLVIMTGVGGGYNDAGQHSQTLFATFAHLPGMKVVCPSNAYDAKGLLNSAINDDSPVVYMLHKGLQGLVWMSSPDGAAVDVPEEPYSLEFGRARVAREGSDVTIVTISMMVHRSLEAAAILADEGIDAEVIDLRTLVPLDRASVAASVERTGRLVVVDEDYQSFGLTGEIIASAVEDDRVQLKSSPQRVALPDVPIPYSRPMEDAMLPNTERIASAVRKCCAEAA